MLLRQVEKFLVRHDMPATKFGRLAAHDPRFVLDLRMGRMPRAKTEARTLRWMTQYEEQALDVQASVAGHVAGHIAGHAAGQAALAAHMANASFETKGFSHAA